VVPGWDWHRFGRHGSCHSFVATLGRLVPRLRGQEFTEDERETVRRGISKVRAAADWLEGAVDHGEFTLDEQLAQLLRVWNVSSCPFRE
jgi:hypothetical protein